MNLRIARGLEEISLLELSNFVILVLSGLSVSAIETPLLKLRHPTAVLGPIVGPLVGTDAVGFLRTIYSLLPCSRAKLAVEGHGEIFQVATVCCKQKSRQRLQNIIAHPRDQMGFPLLLNHVGGGVKDISNSLGIEASIVKLGSSSGRIPVFVDPSSEVFAMMIGVVLPRPPPSDAEGPRNLKGDVVFQTFQKSVGDIAWGNFPGILGVSAVRNVMSFGSSSASDSCRV
ncbi:hypothetical protein R1sor_026547 [Riccia sorocarpa]|uniref:Uncharacterized protein n=1 Tax=Riccia sorocarpa TaxID=122646 RepID=A0ABD3GFS4_9MARC